MEGERREFLPPEPAGPEPELGAGPPPAQPPPKPPPAYPQQPPPPGWGYAPQPVQPGNGPAVSGFVLSLVAGGLLFLSAGVSSIVSAGCAIFGIVQSRKGKRKVESGETSKHAGLAQAGFITGIVSLVLAVLATLVWLLILVVFLTSEEFRDDLEREFDNTETVRALLRIAVALVA